MRINDLNSLANMVQAGQVPERSQKNPVKNGFREAMSTVTRDNYQQKLADMSIDITKQGEIVGRRCDILELKRFKEMITEYLGEAIRFIYEFKKQSTFDARGRHRMYAIIKRINEKLEEMTKELLKSEIDNISVLAGIDEIRGMLVDILM